MKKAETILKKIGNLFMWLKTKASFPWIIIKGIFKKKPKATQLKEVVKAETHFSNNEITDTTNKKNIGVSVNVRFDPIAVKVDPVEIKTRPLEITVKSNENGNEASVQHNESQVNDENTKREKTILEKVLRFWPYEVAVIILSVMFFCLFTVFPVSIDISNNVIKIEASELKYTYKYESLVLDTIKNFSPQVKEIIQINEAEKERIDERLRQAHNFAYIIVFGRYFVIFCCLTVFCLLAIAIIKKKNKEDCFD